MPWISPEFAYPEVPSFMEPVGAGNSLKFDQRRDAENTSRLAFCMGTFITTGWGEYQMPEAFIFDCLFVGRPYVFTGWCLGETSLLATPQVLLPTRYPRVSAGVVEWHYEVRNSELSNLYSSAHLAFTVETRSPEDVTNQDPNIPTYTLTHFFMFAGIGLKRLPQVKE